MMKGLERLCEKFVSVGENDNKCIDTCSKESQGEFSNLGNRKLERGQNRTLIGRGADQRKGSS